MGLRKTHGKKDGPREILSSMFRMPPPTLYTDAMVHINCAGTVQIDNCKGIVAYNENAVELDMGKLRLQLAGDDLVLETVEKGIILVRGQVFGLTFFYSDQKGAKKQSTAARGKDEEKC